MQKWPAQGIVVFFLLGETNTLGSTHKLQECQLMPLYFLACVFLPINTIKQYNARKWVQIGPAEGILVSCSRPAQGSVVFFLLGATNTLGSTPKLQECQLLPF